MVVYDMATHWFHMCPCKTKSAQETWSSLRIILHPEENIRSIYTDNSLEFMKACEELCWNHERSTPYNSETHGIAEKAVRRMKEGTSSVLFLSGLQGSWWAETMECHGHLRNVKDLLADGQTFYERLFNSHLKGRLVHLEQK